MAHALKYLRTVHSWLGVLILPWVVLFGITGFYLNHPEIIRAISPYSNYEDNSSEFPRLQVPLTLEQSADIARNFWNDRQMIAIEEMNYHGHDAIRFQRDSGEIIIVPATGHYYLKTRFSNRMYSPEGELLGRKIYWDYLFGIFHRTGWLSRDIKTVFADITALALVVFGITGLALWYLPRHRRLKRFMLRARR